MDLTAEEIMAKGHIWIACDRCDGRDAECISCNGRGERSIRPRLEQDE